MIGPEKLSIIRERLRQAFAAGGNDPIRQLEECLSAAAPPGSSAGTEHEVLRSLRRFLEGEGKKRRPKQRGRKRK